MPRLRIQSWLVILALLLAATWLFGCASAQGSLPGQVNLRVGYFPNLTHSQALIGLARGDFQAAMPTGVLLQPQVFNAGPSVIEAMFAGQIDLAYIGPNPAINGYVRSEGQALRVVAGATSGGAALVVQPDAGISGPKDLEGKRIASPQLGNTQDIALRSYLAAHGLKPAELGGSVEIVPINNPEILDLFREKQIDGAWVPEPWASRLVVEGGGTVFLDERDLWPGGEFSTAVVIASAQFARAHPDLVRIWLAQHVEITLWERDHPDEAKRLANQEIARLTGKPLQAEVLDEAWKRMDVTYDPLATTLLESAAAAERAGYLKGDPDLSGLVDLLFLSSVLQGRGLPAIKP